MGEEDKEENREGRYRDRDNEGTGKTRKTGTGRKTGCRKSAGRRRRTGPGRRREGSHGGEGK